MTEGRMTEGRKTKGRMTKGRMTERRMTERRMTKGRKIPNTEWPNAELDQTSNWTKRRKCPVFFHYKNFLKFFIMYSIKKSIIMI